MMSGKRARQIGVLGIVLLLFPYQSVWAMGNHPDTLRDQYGRAIGGATVTVYNAENLALATIYSDNGATVKANPFLTDALDGRFNFYAANGVYTLTFSFPGVTFDPAQSTRISIVDGSELTGGGGASTGWPTVLSGSAGTSEAAGGSVSIRGIGGQATNGADFYQGSDGRFYEVCVVATVRNACPYIRQLAAGFYWEIMNAAGTSILRVTNDTGAVTNLTMDAEGSGNALTRPFYWDLDLCAISPADSTLSHIWNKDPLSTAPTLTAKAGTNRSICVATFPDVDGDYGVSIRRRLPDGFTGSFDAEIVWDTAGTGNAHFQVATKCYQHNTADDAAYNTATAVAVGAGTSGRPNFVTNPTITTTGCSGGDLMQIRLFRNRTNGSDTLNAALNIEKVTFRGRATK